MNELLLRNISVLWRMSGSEEQGTDLRITGERISEIGLNLRPSVDATLLDCSGKVVIPGLINTHHHFFQTLTRCLRGAQDAQLFDWLTYHYPVWRHFGGEMIRVAARMAIAELLLTGCTTTTDHLYLFPRDYARMTGENWLGAEVDVARELGIRFSVSRGAMTMGDRDGGLPPDDIVERDEDVLLHAETMIRSYHDPSPFAMTRVHLAPCSPFNVTLDLMRESATLARRYGVRLHTHLAETTDEIKFCLERFGRRPLELMEELEWLGDDVWFAHGVYFDDAEIARLAQTQTGIAHCPSSNMRLGSGVARVPDLLHAGVPVGLAVDGSASNDSSNMLGELRQALLLSRVMYGSDAMPVRQVLSQATEGSAKVLGYPECGRLEVGKAADLAIFDLEKLQYAGAQDPIAALLLCGFDHRAWAVIVNGELVVRDGTLVRADEQEIARTGMAQAKKLWEKAGVT